MATAKVFTMDGAQNRTVELSDQIFDVPPSDALVHEVVVGLQANKRQGTHKTKTRREVRGGGAKPYRQKGTGRARHGSWREPQMRGGGTVFGPQPRSYRKAIPVRMRRKALCCALSKRLRDEHLGVIEGMQFDVPKTKPVAQMLAKIADGGRRTLLVLAGHDKNVLLSTRNIPRVEVRMADDLNALDVLTSAHVVLQEEAIARLEERLS